MNSLTDLMPEKVVYERYPTLFAERELREARQQGLIRIYDLRKGPHYIEAQLVAYVETRLRTGADNSKLDPDRDAPRVSGSHGSRIPGMVPELEKEAAERLDEGDTAPVTSGAKRQAAGL